MTVSGGDPTRRGVIAGPWRWSLRGQPADPNFDHAKYDAVGESDRMTLKFVKPSARPTRRGLTVYFPHVRSEARRYVGISGHGDAGGADRSDPPAAASETERLGAGRSIKLDLKGEGVIHIDGAAVTNDDLPADLVVTVGAERSGRARQG